MSRKFVKRSDKSVLSAYIVQSLRVAFDEEAGGYRRDSSESRLRSFPYIYVYVYILFSTVNTLCKLYFTNFIRLIDT